MKVEKKGVRAQVSTFIIIAVLIVAVAGIFFILKKDVLDLRLGVNPEVKPVYSFVESCIKETAEDALYYIGSTGGYVISPELSTETDVAYYLYNGRNLMPSKEKIEYEISMYIDNFLFFCTREFSDFPDFSINESEIKTQIKIKDEKVVFDISYSLSISKGEKTYSFEDFNIEIPVRLGVIYNAVSEIMQSQMENIDAVCVDCIHNIAEKNDLTIHMTDGSEKEDVVFVVRDESSRIYGESYLFYFVNKYE